MTPRGIVLCVLLVATSTSAPIQASRRRTFATVTIFGLCFTEHTCGAGPGGHSVGPVGTQLHCNRYVFNPDGTYTYLGEFRSAVRGTYTRVGRTITLTEIDERGHRAGSRRLTLSADGNTLGGLRRRRNEDGQ